MCTTKASSPSPIKKTHTVPRKFIWSDYTYKENHIDHKTTSPFINAQSQFL